MDTVCDVVLAQAPNGFVFILCVLLGVFSTNASGIWKMGLWLAKLSQTLTPNLSCHLRGGSDTGVSYTWHESNAAHIILNMSPVHSYHTSEYLDPLFIFLHV